MTNSFKDHFSSQSKHYAKYRPDYPDKLFQYIASLCEQRTLAWDCGTGSGQAAKGLCQYFKQVIATDASEAQIATTQAHSNLTFRVAPAENSDLPNNAVDLISVAQALHWFDIPRFATEAQRVLRPKGILAAWTYNLISITPAVDEIIQALYDQTLNEYWPEERKMVEDNYAQITLPLIEIPHTPAFHMQAYWTLNELIGYFSTWSAVKKYTHRHQKDPLQDYFEALQNAWGPADTPLPVTWPIKLKAWQNDT
ncbi:MAG: class I SAM-dependent methyltransferase [Gammaproteobacteria bacterium]|nr:class I SAM-dependent methyltransferase [Gammaproteobacteria bacterium]